MKLIEQSLKELVKLVDKEGITRCFLPRPGCLNGHLDWETQVKPLCEQYLDDRFTIVSSR